MALTSLPPGCLPQPPTSHLCRVLAQLQGCLCFSVGFPTGLGVWSTRFSPAKGFQLGLGNWCQLLWGELVGTSCAAWQAGSGVWQELGLRTRPWLPQRAQGWEWEAWMQSCWKLVFICQRAVSAGQRSKPLETASMNIRPHMLLLRFASLRDHMN